MAAESITVNGIILAATPVGEYDRRLLLLCAERGKMTVFAKGANRAGSRWSASAQPFVAGTFTLIAAKHSFTLQKIEVLSYFLELSEDVKAFSLGSYFLEFAEYESLEDMESRDLLNLLYLSLSALSKPQIPDGLIRLIFEMRSLVIAGEFPDSEKCGFCGKKITGAGAFFPYREKFSCAFCAGKETGGSPLSAPAMKTISFIVKTPLEKLFTFTVTPAVLAEISDPFEKFLQDRIGHHFRSLAVYESFF